MAPACAGILATYGADVIKIEPPGAADPARGARRLVDDTLLELGFELANNRKRSIRLNLAVAAGRQVLHALLDRADVFVTNLRPQALERLALAPETLVQTYPRLVVAHATGYGPLGPDRDRAAFDELAYWARGGMSSVLRTDDNPPVRLYGAMGDLPSAVALTAGIFLALLRREREGRGGIVDTSLYGAGIWTNGWAVQEALVGLRPRVRGRLDTGNPLYTTYRCADSRWVQFAMFQTDRYWTAVCEVVGRPDLVADERFSTHERRCANSVAAVAELERAIAARTLDEWAPLFDGRDLAWSPIFAVEDIVADEQARSNNYLIAKTHRSGRPLETVAPPFQLRGEAFQLGPAPEAGQHTEEVLLELGFDWDRIAYLREVRAL